MHIDQVSLITFNHVNMIKLMIRENIVNHMRPVVTGDLSTEDIQLKSKKMSKIST